MCADPTAEISESETRPGSADLARHGSWPDVALLTIASVPDRHIEDAVAARRVVVMRRSAHGEIAGSATRARCRGVPRVPRRRPTSRDRDVWLRRTARADGSIASAPPPAGSPARQPAGDRAGSRGRIPPQPARRGTRQPRRQRRQRGRPTTTHPKPRSVRGPNTAGLAGRPDRACRRRQTRHRHRRCAARHE
jgi:hypothetical protein